MNPLGALIDFGVPKLDEDDNTEAAIVTFTELIALAPWWEAVERHSAKHLFLKRGSGLTLLRDCELMSDDSGPARCVRMPCWRWWGPKRLGDGDRIQGKGLGLPEGQISYPWDEDAVLEGMGLDLARIRTLHSRWFVIQGAGLREEICPASEG